MRFSSQPQKLIYQACYVFLPVFLASQSSVAHAATAAVTDKHIREIVESMLREKDKKIEQLEARILQMEQDRQHAAVKTEAKTVADKAEPPAQSETSAAEAAVAKQDDLPLYPRQSEQRSAAGRF